MVQDNPYLEVWRSLSLDQTELISLASILDWTKFGKMILTPLIDIDNLNLSTFWTFVVIDAKGEKNKEISAMGRNRNSVLRQQRGKK